MVVLHTAIAIVGHRRAHHQGEGRPGDLADHRLALSRPRDRCRLRRRRSTAIAAGFGEIMGEVGLLIGFGVLIGAMLHAMGAFKRWSAMLVNGSARTGSRTRWTAAMSTIFPSIYVDVQVVLASPVARSTAPFIGRDRLAAHGRRARDRDLRRLRLRDPGTGRGLHRGPAGDPARHWLLYGLVLGPLTAIVTTLIFRLLLRAATGTRPRTKRSTRRWSSRRAPTELVEDEHARRRHCFVCLLPILVPLVLIAFGAFAEALGVLQRVHRLPRRRQPRAVRRPARCLRALPTHPGIATALRRR